jgi:hypothetical protein
MQDTTSNGFKYMKQKCGVLLAKQRSFCACIPSSFLEKAENSKYSILCGVIFSFLECHGVLTVCGQLKIAWASTKRDQHFSTRQILVRQSALLSTRPT